MDIEFDLETNFDRDIDAEELVREPLIAGLQDIIDEQTEFDSVESFVEAVPCEVFDDNTTSNEFVATHTEFDSVNELCTAAIERGG